MNAFSFSVPQAGRSPVWIFWGLVGLIMVHHSLAYLGFYQMDDINYARYAARLASEGYLHWNVNSFIELRWGAIVGTAIFYRVFGISEITSFAFGFFTVVLTGYLIYRMTHKLPARYVYAALLLFFFDYRILFSTHRIFADSGVMLFSFGAYFCYWLAKDNTKNWWPALAFSICLFLIMVSKETIVLIIPLLLYLFVTDIYKRQKVHFWIAAVSITTFIFFTYLLLFKIQTGDWLYRYHALQKGSYINGCSFDLLPFSETLGRIGYYLWEAFLLNGNMILILFGLCGFIYRRTIMPGIAERKVAVAFFILLMSSNFMTFSYRHYLPLCHDPRHFLMIFPFAAYTGTYMLNAFLDNPRKFWILPMLMTTATAIMFMINGGEMKYIYLLVSCILLLPLAYRLFFRMAVNRTLVFVLLTVTLLIRPAYDVIDTTYDFYYEQKSLITPDFPEKYPNATVYTVNSLTAELSEYFLKFNTGTVSFKLLAQEHYAVSDSSSHVYFLINKKWNPPIADLAEDLSKEPGMLSIAAQNGVMTLYQVLSNNAINALLNAKTRIDEPFQP